MRPCRSWENIALLGPAFVVGGIAALLLVFAARKVRTRNRSPFSRAGNGVRDRVSAASQRGHLPDGLSSEVDGWVFVLPAAAGAEGNFVSVTATFTDAEGNEHVPSTESSAPGEASTTPVGSTLPTTGTPLTIALVSAAALAAGGAALYMIQRRRREAQDW